MRDLNRNKRTVYYALYQESSKIYDSNGDFTGERGNDYADPERLKLNYSAATGETMTEVFGIVNEYQRVISTSDKSCPIKEDTRLWIGVEPNEDADNFNYVVRRKADSVNSLLFLIEEVKVNG